MMPIWSLLNLKLMLTLMPVVIPIDICFDKLTLLSWNRSSTWTIVGNKKRLIIENSNKGLVPDTCGILSLCQCSAHYIPQLFVALNNPNSNTPKTVLDMCVIARRMSVTRIFQWDGYMFEWSVAFQLELLFHNGFLHSDI